MLVFTKKVVAFLMLFGLSMVLCEDEMSLHVSIIEPQDVEQNDYNQQHSDNSVNINNSLDDEDEKSKSDLEDLCSQVSCNIGERCVIDNNEAKCECVESCEVPRDERQKICSSSNQTFDSDCHFLRQKCWCQHKDNKCGDSKILSDTIDYYGSCRYIEHCTEEQKKVFPSRMKIWLDEVLHILNERRDLEPKYKNLVKLADEMKANHIEKYWTAGVAFEFCQLDKSNDHAISKEELKNLVSSIKALENCIQPFLDECDKDGNDFINDNEWAECLDLSDDDLELLRKHC